MGHSAGGHLALLYAYKAAAGHTINGTAMHDISLVISEAGPIEFIADDMSTLADERKAEICAMAGISDIDDENAQTLLDAVSPCSVLDGMTSISAVPYTILAYGDVDTLIQYTMAENMANNFLINRTLHKLNGVGHNDFGVNNNGEAKKVHPINSVNETGAITKIGEYFNDVLTQLIFLKNL